MQFFHGVFPGDKLVFGQNGLREVLGDVVQTAIDSVLRSGYQEFIFQFFSAHPFGEGVDRDQAERFDGRIGKQGIEFGVGDAQLAFEVVDFAINAVSGAGFEHAIYINDPFEPDQFNFATAVV